MSIRYFHGGVVGLQIGGFLLPPSETGVMSCADTGIPGAAEVIQRDRVYLTTMIEAAVMFAALAPCGSAQRGGDVYEVQPIGEVEPDPDYLGADGGSVQCSRAVVVAVIERSVARSLAVR